MSDLIGDHVFVHFMSPVCSLGHGLGHSAELS